MKLVRFLMKCQNESVTVELKTGVLLSGTVASVTPTMNIAMRNVKMTPRKTHLVPNPESTHLENTNIRGSTIRHIILPDNLPLDALLVDDSTKPKNKPRKEPENKGPPGRGRGRGRGGPRGRGRGRGGGRGF